MSDDQPELSDLQKLEAEVRFLRSFLSATLAAISKEQPEVMARLEQYTADGPVDAGTQLGGWERSKAETMLTRTRQAAAVMRAPG